MNLINLAENRWLPDALIRYGIRKLCRQRLTDEYVHNPDVQSNNYLHCLQHLKASPLAVATEAANEQHYEVPTGFFLHTLGKHLKYSACYWDEQTKSLDKAEENMLAMYCERAQLADGQSVLELGCGWGSLSLWMASFYPNSQITAISNSATQKQYIDEQAALRGLQNINVITCDVNTLAIEQNFDRVISIEMFEHVRNYAQLMQKINSWLKDDGKLFVHIFCHRYLMYPFETDGVDNWMGRYFFTGGLMPATDTLLHFQNELQAEQTWKLTGEHYQKTADAWLANLDHYNEEIMDIFLQHYSAVEAKRWLQRWRMFFMACAELFGYRGGREWLVAHYLFTKSK